MSSGIWEGEGLGEQNKYSCYIAIVLHLEFDLFI